LWAALLLPALAVLVISLHNEYEEKVLLRQNSILMFVEKIQQTSFQIFKFLVVKMFDFIMHSQFDVKELCVQAVIIGLISHLLYWIRGLRTPQATRIFIFHLIAFITVSAVTTWYNGFLHGLSTATAVFISYFGGLATSMTIYRIFFHRLRNFPGPFGAKVTKAYGLYISRNYQAHDEVKALFDKYGDIVRTGVLLFTVIDLRGNKC
jgi:hypothetical protein